MLDKCRMIDSGIEWVGDIPQDWLVFPAGGVFSEVKEKLLVFIISINSLKLSIIDIGIKFCRMLYSI